LDHRQDKNNLQVEQVGDLHFLFHALNNEILYHECYHITLNND
jgi:hypothetical protein